MAFHFVREMMLALLLQLVQYNRAAAASVGLPGCSTTCGNTTIPYPFGIGTGCYFEGFNLTCDHAYQPPKLFFGDGTIEVIEISLPESIVRLKSTPLTSLPSEENEVGFGIPRSFSLVLNQSVLIAVGCNIIADILSNDGPVVACTPLCPVNYTGHTCSGIICSQASAPVLMLGPLIFSVKISPLTTLNGSFSLYDAKQNNALLVEQEWLNKHELELIKYLDPFSDHRESESMVMPFVLDWSITHRGYSKGCLEAKENMSEYQCHNVHHLCYDAPYYGYRCKCQPGYEGNAYLHNGCGDIDECQFPDTYPCHGICINVPGTYECYCSKGTHGNAFAGQCISNGTRAGFFIGFGVATTLGIFLLILAILVLFCKLKKRTEKILKKKHFLQNRGLLLQQLLCSNEDVAGRMKIFSIEELEKATNKFDPTRLQGTYGYLDPEYYYTSRLTDKSDVYSFGVILVELLTRETPYKFSRSEAGNLVSRFTSLQRDNCLFEILDPKIVHQGRRAELEGVAQLAEVCLRLKGEERPTMREVEMTLEELRALQKRHAHPWKAESSAEQ